MIIQLIILCLIGTSLGLLVFASPGKPSTQLGASAEVPGGLATISGVIPLEKDDWRPPASTDGMDEAPEEGSHRVRIMVLFTALDQAGRFVDSSGFFVDGLGTGEPRPLWAETAKEIDQGDFAIITLVFDIPDRAIELVLQHETGFRLSLGSVHHTGGP